MIIASKKSMKKIMESLEDKARVFVLGCGECATLTHAGGEKEVAEMAVRLEQAGKNVVATDVVPVGCQELDVKRILRKHKKAVEEADVFLVLSCGAGTQSVRAATDKRVVPGTDSLFVGNVQRSMDFVEKCALCGDCRLDEYGAICPIARCAKGLLNGPCGGVSHGKCEVDPEMDCAWVLIHEQLKKEGREEGGMRIHAPRDWNITRRPGQLAERRAKSASR